MGALLVPTSEQHSKNAAGWFRKKFGNAVYKEKVFEPSFKKKLC